MVDAGNPAPLEPERSGDGQEIIRYDAPRRSFQAAGHGDPEVRAAVDAHLTAHLGPCDSVWHEIISDLVHIDVYMWKPTEERPAYTFATVGMSDLTMAVPEEARRVGRPDLAELLVRLPPEWPVPGDMFTVAPWDNETAYFPILWLKRLARFPHDFDTWLGSGHTMPNGDPPQPLASGTDLCGWLLIPPVTLPEGIRYLELPDGRRLEVFGIVALHRDEMDLKLAQGVGALVEGFERHQISELLDPARTSSLHP